MKEAFERIRLTENENEQALQEVLQTIDQYQQEKQEALKAYQFERQNQRKEALQLLEAQLFAEEKILADALQAEAKQMDETNKRQYLAKKENVIQTIMQEMRGKYGC